MLKTYRITFRSEVFIEAPDADAAQEAFGAWDVSQAYRLGSDVEYVEQSSAPEEYCSPFGAPVDDATCVEHGGPFDDNPGKNICRTCEDWRVTDQGGDDE